MANSDLSSSFHKTLAKSEEPKKPKLLIYRVVIAISIIGYLIYFVFSSDTTTEDVEISPSIEETAIYINDVVTMKIKQSIDTSLLNPVKQIKEIKKLTKEIKFPFFQKSDFYTKNKSFISEVSYVVGILLEQKLKDILLLALKSNNVAYKEAAVKGSIEYYQILVGPFSNKKSADNLKNYILQTTGKTSDIFDVVGD
jgi:hypothetical protein